MFEDLMSGFFSSSPFDDFRRLENQMDELLGRSTGVPPGIRAVQRGAFPPINVGSTPDKVTMYLFAAGLDPKSLDVSIRDNLLTVTGSRKIDPIENLHSQQQPLRKRAIRSPSKLQPSLRTPLPNRPLLRRCPLYQT